MNNFWPSEHSLEVHLNKKHSLHWPRLLYDVVIDQSLIKSNHPIHIASEVETIQDRHTTASGSADENATPTGSLKPAFNVEQLEDVDYAMDQDEDDLVLQRFDGETLKVTHQVSRSLSLYVYVVCVLLVIVNLPDQYPRSENGDALIYVHC